MKYTVENQVGSSLYYTLGGGLNITVLLLSCIAAIAAAFIIPHPVIGFLAGAYVMLIMALFVGAAAAISQQTKLLAADTIHFPWTYEITESTITIAALDKIKLTYEKGGLKAAEVYRGGVMVRHERGVFFLPFPTGTKQELIEKLMQYGWLKKGQWARRWRLFALLFLVWMLLGMIAAAVAYFLY